MPHLELGIGPPAFLLLLLLERNAGGLEKEEHCDEGREDGDELPPAQHGRREDEEAPPEGDLATVVGISGVRPEADVHKLALGNGRAERVLQHALRMEG